MLYAGQASKRLTLPALVRGRVFFLSGVKKVVFRKLNSLIGHQELGSTNLGSLAGHVRVWRGADHKNLFRKTGITFQDPLSGRSEAGACRSGSYKGNIRD